MDHTPEGWNELVAKCAELEKQRDELQEEAYRTAGMLVRLVTALRIIGGYEQCADNTMSNVEIARQALDPSDEDLFIGKAIAKEQGVQS
jgi:hypothetical protein